MYLLKIMKQLVNQFLCLVLLCTWSEAANILCLYPAPFYSHQMVQRALTEELASNYHQLVVLTPLPHQEPVANITEIDFSEKTFALWDKGYAESFKNRQNYAIPDAVKFWNIGSEIMAPIHELYFEHPKFQALVKDETKQFDLILIEATSYIQSVVRSRFKAPIILVSTTSISSSILNMVGAETNHFLYPDLNVHLTWNISFWERICSLYNLVRLKLSQWEYKKVVETDMKNKYGQQISVSREFKEGVTMIFLSMHRFWDNNRPTPIGTVIYMDGVHFKARKDLPKDLSTFVNQSKHGVVVVSLGSKLKSSTLPVRTLRAMVDVFGQLPYDIIWKWDSNSVMPNKPKNIRLEKWLPQYDLLHHPNVKAFVTHGGMQSTEEAIDAGVPMIGLPVFLDQWLNTQQYEKHQIGIRLNIDYLIEQEFKNAILAVLNEKKYRDNVRRLSHAMAEMRARGGLAAAARALRRLAAHGPRHLRAPLADATLVEYYMIDLILAALFFGLIFYFLIIFVSKRIFKSLKYLLVGSKHLPIKNNKDA